MTLMQRTGKNGTAAVPMGAETDSDIVRYRSLLLEEIDLEELSALSETQRRARLERIVGHLLTREGPVLSTLEHSTLIRRIVDEALGLGVLEPLLADESSPMVDARLPTGERVNIIVPPLSLAGPAMTIRRFPRAFTIDQLVGMGSLDEPVRDLLGAIVRARCNVIISGGTGTGKTTFLNAMSGLIPDSERIITIEDAAELQLQQPHVVPLEARPPNVEGKGQVTIRDLVRNSLRMRPDRIIVGEVRGGETLDMLQAMNTGHEGSLATVHANSTVDAITRLETLASMTDLEIAFDALRDQVNSAVDVMVHLNRYPDGSRRVGEVAVVASERRQTFKLESVVAFQAEIVGPAREVRGAYAYRPLPPGLQERLVNAGERIPEVFAARAAPVEQRR